MSIFFLSHENPVPGYCNVFFDFFCGNIGKLNRDREINPQQFNGFIFFGCRLAKHIRRHRSRSESTCIAS
ncbi:hypothetical protein CRU79_14475 [Escherichia sp. E4385]|nr:hypothetical protein CRU79_14475 [Escherichia sp. E4385]